MLNYSSQPFGKTLSKIRAGELVTRETAQDYYSLASYLPDPDPILVALNEDQTIYETLQSDAHLSAAIVSRKAGVKKFKWELIQGDSTDEQMKFMEEQYALFNMYTLVDDILNDFLRGYQPLEIMWSNKFVNVNGKIMATDIIAKPPEWFVFDSENRLRFKSKAGSLEGELLPERKILLSRYQATYKNPYGTAELSKCYWPVTFKRGMVEFWVRFGEKFGMPFATAFLPRGSGDAEYSKVVDQLTNLIQDACAAFPENTKISLLEPQGKSASIDVYERFIRWCNSEISKAILGHTGALDSTPGKLGSENAALEVRSDIIDSDKRRVEQTMNDFNRMVCEINFAEKTYPKLSLVKEFEVDKTLAERDKISYEMGWRPSKEYFINNYNYSNEEFELNVEAEVEPEAEPLEDGGINV